MWAVGDTWECDFTALMAQADAGEDLNRAVAVDFTSRVCTSTRPGPARKGPRLANRPTMPWAGPGAG
ncbi:hypothetical protein DY245_42380 [Streptomyces inhibens]|uniref:Uncharacterized protein n=1 Tax=Streptomyces inhibens TaxID=2293571 RepID=A0A371PQ24_STRIH|nr:hypothetical protein DY245_42380 [Streptomyces inhibens]